MPDTDSNFNPKKSSLPNILGLGFLVLSLLAITVTVSDPLRKQLIASFAAPTTDYNLPRNGSTTTSGLSDNCQTGCSSSDILLPGQANAKIGYQYSNGDIAGFYQQGTDANGNPVYYPIAASAGGPTANDLSGLAQTITALKSATYDPDALGKLISLNPDVAIQAENVLAGQCKEDNNPTADCNSATGLLDFLGNEQRISQQLLAQINSSPPGSYTNDQINNDLAQLKTLADRNIISQDQYNKAVAAATNEINAANAAAAKNNTSPSLPTTPQTQPTAKTNAGCGVGWSTNGTTCTDLNTGAKVNYNNIVYYNLLTTPPSQINTNDPNSDYNQIKNNVCGKTQGATCNTVQDVLNFSITQLKNQTQDPSLYTFARDTTYIKAIQGDPNALATLKTADPDLYNQALKQQTTKGSASQPVAPETAPENPSVNTQPNAVTNPSSTQNLPTLPNDWTDLSQNRTASYTDSSGDLVTGEYVTNPNDPYGTHSQTDTTDKSGTLVDQTLVQDEISQNNTIVKTDSNLITGSTTTTTYSVNPNLGTTSQPFVDQIRVVVTDKNGVVDTTSSGLQTFWDSITLFPSTIQGKSYQISP